jgi:hypothetical protein
MTRTVSRTSAIALGMAALVSLSPVFAWADPSAEPAPNPAPTSSAAAPSTAPTPTPPERPATSSSATAPSLAEPAPTPSWAESGPQGPTVAQQSGARRYSHHYVRHYAWRNGRRYYSDNPVATAATGVAGGVADLGSIAAYPFYCFPNYGSCSVRVPYRY